MLPREGLLNVSCALPSCSAMAVGRGVEGVLGATVFSPRDKLLWEALSFPGTRLRDTVILRPGERDLIKPLGHHAQAVATRHHNEELAREILNWAIQCQWQMCPLTPHPPCPCESHDDRI